MTDAPNTTSPNTGRFVWRELMTSDVEAAKAFYAAVFGWTFVEAPIMKGYFLAHATPGDNGVCGLTALEQPGVPPHWMSTISVGDVDATSKAVERLGGKTLVPKMEIPTIGDFAVLTDGGGAAFSVLHPTSPGPEQGIPKAGEFCWETLMTNDREGAVRFYGEAFGWTLQDDGHPVFKSGDAQIADIEGKPGEQPDAWIAHVVVPEIEAALAKVTANGGTILMPATKMDGVGYLSCIRDPQGAVICPFQSLMG